MNKTTLILLISLLCVSCVETVSLDTNEELPLVVSCVLKNQDVQELLLYEMSTIETDNPLEPVPVTDAVVTLCCSGEKVGEFVHSSGRLWRLNYRPVSGKVYDLDIYAGERHLKSSTVMPDSISYVSHLNSMMLSSYQNLAASWGTYYTYALSTTNDAIIWAYFTDSVGKIVPKIATNHSQVDNFNIIDGEAYYQRSAGDEIVLFWPYHLYAVRIAHPEKYANCYYVKLSEWEEQEYKQTFIRNEEFVGEDHMLYGKCFNFFSDPQELQEANLVMMNVSGTYDKYLRENYAIISKQNDKTDFTGIFEYSLPYSNIEGGQGVFGAAFINNVKKVTVW